MERGFFVRGSEGPGRVGKKGEIFLLLIGGGGSSELLQEKKKQPRWRRRRTKRERKLLKQDPSVVISSWDNRRGNLWVGWVMKENPSYPASY